jgi:FkbM family methyltransferase
MVVKTWDGFIFIARARTPDLYAIAVEEVFELENWFKPLAKGVVVDVGAYIGTYTVRAMRTADLVVAIEPFPPNFVALQKNVELNGLLQRAETVLVNKAVADERGRTRISASLKSGYMETTTARLGATPKEECVSYMVDIDTLDNILSELGIDKVDMLKIDIEGYVLKSLLGMLNTLKRTSWLLIELWEQDMPAVKELKGLGFRLKARHGANFLFKNEDVRCGELYRSTERRL